MSKYSDLVKGLTNDNFNWDSKYKKPRIEPLIVGLSGIDPDEKLVSSEIDHEFLSGILGGNLTGHYHLTSEQLAQVKSFKREINTLANLLSTFSTALGNRISDLEKQQQAYEADREEFEETVSSTISGFEKDLNTAVADFTETKEQISTRMDAIVGQATEDTEILDARTDADYVIHPNLGHNIRNIHQLLIDYINYESSYRECRDNDLKEQIDELSEAMLREMYRVCDALLKYQKALTAAIEDARSRERNIYSLIDELSCAVISEAYRKYKFTEDYQNALDTLEERVDNAVGPIEEQIADDEEVEDSINNILYP